MFHRPTTKSAVLYALILRKRKGFSCSKPRDLYPIVQETLGLGTRQARKLRDSYPHEPAFKNEVRWGLQDLKDEQLVAHKCGEGWSLTKMLAM